MVLRVVDDAAPDAGALNELYRAVGWDAYYRPLSISATTDMLATARYRISIYNDDALVAFARVSGDAYSAIINDVIVHPRFRHRGLGTSCMMRVAGYLTSSVHSFAVVVDRSNERGFYEKFGFLYVGADVARLRVWKNSA